MKIEQVGISRAVLDALAGAVAGGVSRTVVSPLDVIKIRFQVQMEPTSTRRSLLSASNRVSKYTGVLQATREIVQEEGLVGLWRGNVPALLLVMPYTAIQFVVLERFKTLAAEYSTGDEISPGMHYVGGAVAGAAGTIGSYPFDLLRTIMASQGEPKVYLTMRSAFMGIVRSRGVSGLYAGLLPSLVEIVPCAGLLFGSYNTLKTWTQTWNEGKRVHNDLDSQKLSTVEHFICGLAAGTFAKIFCHPLDVVKKRFQVEGLARHPRYGAGIEEKAYKNMLDAVRKLLKKEGWTGLYKGAVPSILKAAPASAITLVVYEQVLSLGLSIFGTSTSESE